MEESEHLQWILDRFKDPPLEVVLVVLGGGRSYGYADDYSDYDYFVYYKGEVMTRRYVNDDVIVKAYSITDAIQRLEGKHAMKRKEISAWDNPIYTLENWLWHKPVYETDEGRRIREEVFRPYLGKKLHKWYNAAQIRRKMGNRQTIRDRLLRTRKHLQKTGELECDYETLINLYPVI